MLDATAYRRFSKAYHEVPNMSELAFDTAAPEVGAAPKVVLSA